ncbi:MAG TPA: apolipoprotein N-acyltransferase [Acetobacteraceae bacterium]|nr:apolipoprotein N-acyltransferase [Acetobacteraceae bacterium]
MGVAARPAGPRSWLAGLRGGRADLTAWAAGLLAALALPPIFLLPALLLAVPVLLVLVGSAPSLAVALRRGWWFGLGVNLVGLYWITDAIMVEAARFWWFIPIAVPALAAVLALFIAFAAGMAWLARPGWPRVAALASAWVLGDLARQFIATGFPWNLWGSVWEFPGRAGDVMIQPAALVSIHGLTLATLALAALPLLGWRFRLAGVALLAAWAGFGIHRLAAASAPAPNLTAVLVQGDILEGQKWSPALAQAIFARYLDLTREGVREAGPGPKLVIWPETASPYLIERDPVARQMIAHAAGDATSLIGAVRFDPRGRPRNSLFALGPTGAIEDVYDKWHLVPFGEYQPGWFPLPVQIVPGDGFAAGPGPETMHVAGLPAIGPLICYEAIFPGQVADEADRPALLVNITNDAWFGNSTGPHQHLAAARMRAVEEGLPLLRAANTGISAAFDGYGHQLARLGLGRAGTLIVRVPGPLPATPFARFGLWIPLTFALIGLGAGLAPGLRRG